MLSLSLAGLLALTGCSGDTGSNTAQNNNGGQTATNGGSTDSSSSGPKILRVNNSSEPGSLHPAKAQGTHESWPLRHLFVGLTEVVEGNKIEPAMAEKWDISPDGKTYTFHLRDGIKWSNGDPVTAADFEFAWKYALNPNTASDYAYQLYYIEGAEAYNTSKEKDPAKLKALEDKVGVKALDDKTLQVKLTNPTAYFLELAGFYTYFPVNKKVQEQNPNWANDASTFVSNGPFKLTEWKHKEGLKMVKNENYFDKDKIKIDEIDWAMIEDENTAWQMYRSGDLDLAYPLPTDVIGQLKSSNSPELHIDPEYATYFYRFNTTKKPFNNVKVRKALAMAIDRQAIVDNVTQAGQKPAYGLVALGSVDENGNEFHQTDYFKEDVAQAKQLLAEGLKEEGLTSMPKFKILYNTLDAHKKIAEAIQSMWRDNLGIECELENAEFQVKIDREHKLDYDISRAGWIGDFMDPMTFMDMFTSLSTQNDTGWKNKEYDALVEKAKQSNDQKVRMQAMRDAEKLFMDEMPVMPIYFYTKPYAVKPYVKGVYALATEYPTLKYADIQK
nr:peptide ABC transporter substrate-binding protein [Brevibacillus sp. SYP-B805]